ncbi:MAG TPA: hypothetical protein VIJ82_16535 [Streptosporangiaceae bacterium]|jgi:hypothetical protein
MKKQEEATRVIAVNVRAHIIPVPLDISDARLLQWPMKDTSMGAAEIEARDDTISDDAVNTS